MSVEQKERDLSYRHVSQMDDGEAAKFIMGEIQKAIANKYNDFVRNERYDRTYQSLDAAEDIIDDTTGDVSEDAAVYSNTFLPIGAWLVDTATIKVYRQIFSTPDYFDIDADEWLDDLRAWAVKAHLIKRHREMAFKTQMFRVIQAAMTFDYSIVFDTWKTRWGLKPTVVEGTAHENIGGVSIPYKSKKVEYRGGIVCSRSDMQVIDFFQCAHDYNAGPKMEDSKMFCDWSMPQFWELLQENKADSPFGKYKNLDQVYKSVLEDMGATADNTGAPVRQQGTQPEQERIRRYRFFTHEEIFELSRGVVIRREKCDGMPLSRYTAYELSGRFRGMGVLQRIERSGIDINAIINQKRDFGNLINNPIAVLSRDLHGVEEGDTNLVPGKAYVTDGTADKKIVFYTPAANLATGSTEELVTQIQMAKQVTGFGSENAGGDFANTGRTAREVSAVAAGILDKTSVIAERYEEEGIAQTLLRQFKMEQMYLSVPETFKYRGKGATDFVTIRPEDYAWGSSPRFTMKGATYAQYRDIQFQQFMKAVAVTAELYPQGLNMQNVIAHMWQKLEPNDYLNFIQDPRTPQENISPNVENMLMAIGHQVRTSPLNNDAAHVANHETQKLTPDYRSWPESYKSNMERHIQEHNNKATQGMVAGGARPPMQLGDSTPQAQDSSDLMRGMRGGNLSV